MAETKGLMTTFVRTILAALTLLAISSLAARAQNISGSYSNDCGSMVKLWDLSGYYSEDNGVETESFTLDMDANGNVTGKGHFNLTDYSYSVYLDGDLAVSGKVTSAGTVTRLKLVLTTIAGSGSVEGNSVTFKVTEKENFEVDSFGRELVGTGSGKITLTAYGKSKSTNIRPGYVSALLPDEVDGNWGLSVNTTVNGTKYGGTSAIQLSNGKTFDLGVTGTYSAKSGLSKISLKSTDRTRPLSLNLLGTCENESINIRTLKGKALGQNLRYSD